MNTRHLIDPEVLPILELIPFVELNLETLAQLRQVAPFPDVALAPEQIPEVVHVPGPDGAPDVPLRIFRPRAPRASRPAIFHIHGGGYVSGSAAMMDLANGARAADYDAVVVSVDYRLAPENRFPRAIEDCYAGLRWLADNAVRLGVDSERIAIMGESAGGGLAAALALLARDRGSPKISAQFLIYPMLDHRTGGPDDVRQNHTVGEFVWTRQHNQFAWSCLRGNQDIDADRIHHFSPSLAKNLAGLPRCYMAVGSVDLFLEENIEYALRLVRAGIAVEIHSYAGGVHSFDLVPEALVSRCFAADLANCLKRWL
jgi:triacylglycerol lipase